MIKLKFRQLILWINFFSVLVVFSDISTQRLSRITYLKNDDPEIHLENLNYGRLTFLRGCLAREQHLNKEGSCNAKCSVYNNTRYYHHYRDTSMYEALQCDGNIVKCTKQVNNQLYQLSINNEHNDTEVNKFGYHSIQLTNDELLVKNDWSSCRMCKCYCDDDSKNKSVRSFCQDIIESDTALGYVLTGIRLRIIGRIIHLEIQQGKLINGSIDLYTVHWKNSNPCKYYGLLYYNHRSLQLDDVIAPEGRVVTGVMWFRYHRPTSYLGFEAGRLSLGIKSTKVDHHGNILHEEWSVYEKASAVRRRLLQVHSLKILTSMKNKSKEMSTPNKHYIKFRPTDWTRDFAQHVVPFIDLQEVITNPPRTISGVGVYYRASDGYGGFVALKLILKD